MAASPDPETIAAVQQLLGEYCRTMDSGAFEEWVALFARDGRMAMGAREIVGPEALLRFATKAPRGIHLSGLPVITAGDGASVRSSCPWTFVELATGVQAVGYYHDDIGWSEGRHQFLRRQVEMYFPPVRTKE
jgi:hypothetical protein